MQQSQAIFPAGRPMALHMNRPEFVPEGRQAAIRPTERRGPHHDLIQDYALDGPLDLPSSSGHGDVLDAMKGRVRAKGLLTGIDERN